jgi:hypothetical protein
MSATAAESIGRPVVYDLGKAKRGQIKDLKRGHGKLVGEVNELIAQVRSTLGEAGHEGQIVPIVVVYRRKTKRRRRRRSGLPFPLPFPGF